MLRAMNIVMAVLFAISALLQLNDPDPAQWFLIYAAASLVCGMSAGKASAGWQAPALVGLAALVWAVWSFTHIEGGPAWTRLTESMKAETPQIEETRESLGLILVALWMGVVMATRLMASGAARR